MALVYGRTHSAAWAGAATAARVVPIVVIGPLGGVLLLLGSPALAFLVNAVTFGLSALAVISIPAGYAFRSRGPAKAGPGSGPGSGPARRHSARSLRRSGWLVPTSWPA